MTAYLELGASWLFANAKGRDAGAFSRRPVFARQQTSSVRLTSPDCGDTGAVLGADYMAGDKGWIPSLEWENVEGVKEWVIVGEDLDVPLPTPLCHGIYVGIPAAKTTLNHLDLEVVEKGSTKLKGGFHYGSAVLGSIWRPPRPLLNHGVHRYELTLVALSEPLDRKFIASKPSRDQVAAAIEGKIIGWGKWMGQCERRWD